MINEIKMDKIDTHPSLGKPVQETQPVQPTLVQQKDVHVTNHLNALVNLVKHDPESINAASLKALQSRIQHNEYQINFDQLSDKLLSNGILTIGDE